MSATESALSILLGTVFVNNFVLVKFLGLCPFMGVSKRVDAAAAMGLATTFVLTLAALLSYLVEHYLLAPYDAQFLRTFAFIGCIAAVVQLTEMYLRKHSPILFNAMGLYLPLITTNCAVLGVALLNVQAANTALESAIFGFGASLGFTLAMVLFAGIRERLDAADVPKPFRGLPVALLAAGIMSMAFMGFAGMAR